MTWVEHIVVGAAAGLIAVNVWQGIKLRRAERELFRLLVVLEHVAIMTFNRSELPLWRAWAGRMGVVRMAVQWKGFDVTVDPTTTQPDDLTEGIEVRRG
jgi:hypothetical protein